MPHFTSQHSTQGSSQQDRAQRLLVDDCGFRPSLSHGSASSFCSSEQSTPPKLVPIFKKRRPSRQASLALLRLRKQKELLLGTSQETGRVTLASFGTRALPITSSSPSPSRLTTMTFPALNLVSAPPGQPRLWVPPAAKSRCHLKTTFKQSSERADPISKHQTSSDSSSQVSVSHLCYIQTEPHSPVPHTPAAPWQ